MIVGVVYEGLEKKNRPGLTPALVGALVAAGHRVLVETDAGRAAGFGDASFRDAGARVVTSAEEVFARAGLLVLTDAPVPTHFRALRPGQLLLAPLGTPEAAAPLHRACRESEATCLECDVAVWGESLAGDLIALANNPERALAENERLRAAVRFVRGVAVGEPIGGPMPYHSTGRNLHP